MENVLLGLGAPIVGSVYSPVLSEEVVNRAADFAEFRVPALANTAEAHRIFHQRFDHELREGAVLWIVWTKGDIARAWRLQPTEVETVRALKLMAI